MVFYLKKAAYLSKGGAIEAMPNSSELKPFSLSFLVEPDGVVQYMGSYDKLALKEVINFGCIYP
jgi:hypothetical protein